MDALRLKGKTAIVTGAARGIGAAIATRFAAEGATVILSDLNEEGLAETAEAIGPQAHFRKADAGDWDQMLGLIDGVAAEFGDLDILVNNAGINRAGLIPGFDIGHWNDLLRINVSSVFFGCKAALPHMQRQGSGAIINIASIAGLRGETMATAYSATKAAVVNFSRSLALDHADENIRVNCICPGSVVTEMNSLLLDRPDLVEHWVKTVPVGRFGKTDDVAALAAYLASDEAAYVIGQAIAIDGGTAARMAQPNWLHVLRDAGLVESGSFDTEKKS